MKLGSIIMTLRKKGSPWNTAIRNHFSQKNSKRRPRLERSCWLLEIGTCCSCRLSWKRNNNKLSMLHWNSYCIKKKNERFGIRNETLLQHDNARPHTSAATRDVTQCLEFSVLPHPPYSPDLAPSDFHLFPKLKEYWRASASAVMKRWSLQWWNGFKNKTPVFIRTDLKI